MPWVGDHKKAKENRESPTDFSIPVWRVWSVIVSISSLRPVVPSSGLRCVPGTSAANDTAETGTSSCPMEVIHKRRYGWTRHMSNRPLAEASAALAIYVYYL